MCKINKILILTLTFAFFMAFKCKDISTRKYQLKLLITKLYKNYTSQYIHFFKILKYDFYVITISDDTFCYVFVWVLLHKCYVLFGFCYINVMFCLHKVCIKLVVMIQKICHSIFSKIFKRNQVGLSFVNRNQKVDKKMSLSRQVMSFQFSLV